MVRVGEIEHGEKIAGQAESIWNWSSPAGKQRAKRRAALIAEAAGLSPQTYALELGCGTGLFTQTFARSGSRLVAVDISPPLLEQARARGLPSNVEFRVEDAEQLSFGDAVFDAVIGSSVLHHLAPTEALAEARRVLKPGGRLVLAEPNMMNPHIAIERKVPAVRRWVGASPEETAFFRWGLARQLRDAGFKDIHITPFDFLHPSVPGPLIPMVQRMGTVFEQMPFLREIAGSLLISATCDENRTTVDSSHQRSASEPMMSTS